MASSTVPRVVSGLLCAACAGGKSVVLWSNQVGFCYDACEAAGLCPYLCGENGACCKDGVPAAGCPTEGAACGRQHFCCTNTTAVSGPFADTEARDSDKLGRGVWIEADAAAALRPSSMQDQDRAGGSYEFSGATSTGQLFPLPPTLPSPPLLFGGQLSHHNISGDCVHPALGLPCRLGIGPSPLLVAGALALALAAAVLSSRGGRFAARRYVQLGSPRDIRLSESDVAVGSSAHDKALTASSASSSEYSARLSDAPDESGLLPRGTTVLITLEGHPRTGEKGTVHKSDRKDVVVLFGDGQLAGLPLSSVEPLSDSGDATTPPASAESDGVDTPPATLEEGELADVSKQGASGFVAAVIANERTSFVRLPSGKGFTSVEPAATPVSVPPAPRPVADKSADVEADRELADVAKQGADGFVAAVLSKEKASSHVALPGESGCGVAVASATVSAAAARAVAPDPASSTRLVQRQGVVVSLRESSATPQVIAPR